MLEEDLMDFLTDEEEPAPEDKEAGDAWKVMIIDDDPAVHEATTFSLGRVQYQGRGIHWLSAYSAKEAKRLLENERDIAMLFLDVVMEEDHAGLDFAKWFREEHINPSTRIILRTGQPGQAPEHEIILTYDLHDYKTKTELTSDKLFTSTIAALRAYQDMTRLEEMRRGLERVVSASASILQMQRLPQYVERVMEQTREVLQLEHPAMLCAQKDKDGTWKVLSTSGTPARSEADILQLARKAKGLSCPPGEGYALQILQPDDARTYALYLEPKAPLEEVHRRMLQLFGNNVSVGLSNIHLYDSLLHANRTTVMALAQVTESRDQSTGEHVYRIARGVEMLARELFTRGLYPEELSEELVETIGFASTLHDIGKVTIRDEVLLKPGKLTDGEFAEIKTHTSKGAEVLEAVLTAAGEPVDYLEKGKRIALNHHERWDGRGYPNRLRCRDIPVEARITAVLDVFDALTHVRCYKPAMPLEEACGIIRDGKGSAFDPVITEVFLEMIQNIAEVMI